MRPLVGFNFAGSSGYGTIHGRRTANEYHVAEVDDVLMKVRNYLFLLGIAGAAVALDQWTKYLVRIRLELGEPWMPVAWLAPYARVVHWRNTGAALGLFPSGGLLFTAIAVVVSLAILYYFPRVPARQIPLRLALALQLGGAIGNLIDRLIYGTVTDFIAVGSFPVFNLADASIFIGVAVLAASMWVDDRRGGAEEGAVTCAEIQAGEDGVSEMERPAG
jgi:signal peptidase II